MKKYLDPITKDKFISGDEYFKTILSMVYEKQLEDYNKPINPRPPSRVSLTRERVSSIVDILNKNISAKNNN